MTRYHRVACLGIFTEASYQVRFPAWWGRPHRDQKDCGLTVFRVALIGGAWYAHYAVQ